MSWDVPHFFFAQNGAQEPPSEDKKNNHNEQQQTTHQDTTSSKISEQMKAPIEIPGRLDYKRRMQIQISGHRQEPQIETQSVARSPQNSGHSELAGTLNLSENKRPQNASFRKLEASSSDLRNCRHFRSLLLVTGRKYRFAGPCPHCGGSIENSKSANGATATA